MGMHSRKWRDWPWPWLATELVQTCPKYSNYLGHSRVVGSWHRWRWLSLIPSTESLTIRKDNKGHSRIHSGRHLHPPLFLTWESAYLCLSIQTVHVGSLMRPVKLITSRTDSTANPGDASIPKERTKEQDELERQCIADVSSPTTSYTEHHSNHRWGIRQNPLLWWTFDKTPGFAVQQVPFSTMRTNFPTTTGFLKRNITTRALVATGKIPCAKDVCLNE